jgi:RNA polymerase sigma factor (sigma-70 family)
MNSADPVFLEWRARPSRDNLRLLLLAHQDRVYSLCFQVLRHAQDADDAAQASLVEIARGVLGIREPRAFNSWLYRVCLNNALNLRRERGRRRDREERSVPRAPVVEEGLRDAVHDAIARLNDEDRALVVEHYFEKETLEDLGARRGISGVAVWKRIELAKERLKRALAGVAGMTKIDGVLASAEPVVAPPGLSVQEALLRKDIAPPVTSRAPVRILALAAAVVVAAIIAAVLIANRFEKETKEPAASTPSKPVETPIPQTPPKPVAPRPPQEDSSSRVLGPDGHPVEGALVFPGRWYRLRGDDAFDAFRPESIKDGVTTDEEGKYTLATDRPFITAWHPEFSPTTVAKSEAGTIRLRARGAIRGRVVDSSGKPVEGVAITLDKRGPKATTDGEGRFEFDRVIAGYRGLIFPNNRWIAVRVEPAETLNLEIGPGVDVTLDLGGHPKGPGVEVTGGLLGTGRTASLMGAR